MNSRTAARDENVRHACGLIDEAARGGAQLIVLPEFFNNEYFPQYRDSRYMDYAEPEDGPTQCCIKARARQHGVHIVSTIFEMARPGLYYDTAMLIDPDGDCGKVPKGSPCGAARSRKDLFSGRLVVPRVYSAGLAARHFDLL